MAGCVWQGACGRVRVAGMQGSVGTNISLQLCITTAQHLLLTPRRFSSQYALT